MLSRLPASLGAISFGAFCAFAIGGNVLTIAGTLLAIIGITEIVFGKKINRWFNR